MSRYVEDIVGDVLPIFWTSSVSKLMNRPTGGSKLP